MKYISVDKNGVYVIESYLKYLKVSNLNINQLDLVAKHRWDIYSPTSLHDANIQNISFNIDWKASNERDAYSIELILNGPMEDRTYKLNYFGVTESSFDNIVHYGDLFIHELYKEDDFFVHTLVFSNATLIIKAQRVDFVEEIF